MVKEYRINTRKREIKVREINENELEFGGRGLIAKIMSEEVEPKCDPLGAENKFIVCTGLLAGTSVPTAHRLSVGGKSPLTGGIKESNSGGGAGGALARQGIKMLIFEDKPADGEWSILVIDKKGNVELKDAGQYIGLNNYKLVELLKDEFGDDIEVISIGVSGERGYKNSTLQVTEAVTGYPARALARGGMGSVLGSKKIKAIVISDPEVKYEREFADKEKYNKANQKLKNYMRESEETKRLNRVGTMFNVDANAPSAALPVRNFRGEFFEDVDKIDSEAMVKKLNENGGKSGIPCQKGCLIGCSNIYNDKNGNYLTSGLEYETVAMCGANCDIANLDYLAEISRLCDDIGLDTIETGSTIAICMEAGKIEWGDKEAALGLIKEMKEGTKFGQLLGQGTEIVGKELGVERIPTVKGQSLPSFDPRNQKGMGVTFATTAMGADHTTGITLVIEGMDNMRNTTLVVLSSVMQSSSATADNMMCLFGWFSLLGSEYIVDVLEGIYGGEWDMERVIGIGVRTIMMENEFNKKAGFTKEDDRLPDFFYKEKSPATGAVFDISQEEISKVYDNLLVKSMIIY